MEAGRLIFFDMPEAERALEIANATSYWTSVRKRVMDRIFVNVDNPHGEDAMVSMPEIIAHGTVTRRTVEGLMVTMCSTKKWRVGTELKSSSSMPRWLEASSELTSMVKSYKLLPSMPMHGKVDLLAHHLWLTQFYLVLRRKVLMLTLLLAKAVNISRDTAKGVGFAMLYGAGVRTIGNTIKKSQKDRSPSELRSYATRALSFKKGVKNQDGVYEGGSDSGCYNYMEKIALRSRVPTLPCLGTKISTALRPAAVGSDFHTGRINWTIQSSGAEMLAILLTATHWLARRFKIPAQFILSIHDETWFMVPEKYAEQFAVVFQMAHLVFMG